MAFRRPQMAAAVTSGASLPDDLPAWMRLPRRRIDWGLLIVAVFGVFVAWPLLAWPGVPRQTDAPLFIARSLQVAETLRAGTFYTRWAPDFNFGLGSPLFNYLAPLPHFLSGLHQLITDADPADSIKILFGLSILAAGTGMYRFVRDRYGALAGLIGGLAYLGSPPLALMLPYQTGDLASLLSLGLLPWALWRLDRLARLPTRRNFAVGAGLIAVWSLADTRLTLLGSVLIAVLIVFSPQRRLAVWAVISAALLTAFFWLPALAEWNAVTWIPLADDARAGTIALAEQFVIPQPSLLVNPPLARGLGSGLIVLALIGGSALLDTWRRRVRLPNVDAGFDLRFGVIGLAALIGTLPLFAGIWPPADGWLPLMPYHLLIGLALPCLALLAGYSAYWLGRLTNTRIRIVALIALSLIAVAGVIPALSHVAWSDTPALAAPTETTIHAISTLRTGLLLPTAANPPGTPVDALLINSLADAPPKPDPGVLQIDHTPLAVRYTVDVTGQRVRFNVFAFPGWYITVDGAAHDAETTTQGLLTLILPATAREVIVAFGTTPIRGLSWLITLGGGLIALWRLRTLGTVRAAEPETAYLPARDALTGWIVCGLCLAIGLAFHGMAIPLAVPIHTPVIPPSQAGIALTAYVPDLSDAAVLYWQAQTAPPLNYQLEMRLVRISDQTIIARSREWYPGGVPTSQWLPGETVRDPLRFSEHFPQLHSATAGVYAVEIAWGRCATSQVLPCESPTLLADWQRLPSVIDIP